MGNRGRWPQNDQATSKHLPFFAKEGLGETTLVLGCWGAPA